MEEIEQHDFSHVLNSNISSSNSGYVQIYEGQLLPDAPIIEGQIAEPGPENLRILRQRYIPALEASKLPLNDLRVLEVGAGFGRLTHAFMQELRPSFYLATEPFVSLCKVLRKNMDEWGYQQPRGLVGAYDANYPSTLKKGAINLVIGNNVLHHILDYRKCITHLSDILDAPGMMIFVEPIQEAWAYWVSVVKSALLLNSKSQFELSERTRTILTRHTENLEDRMSRKDDLEYLRKLDDKHIFSIPELMNIAAENNLRFYCYKTEHVWINMARFRLTQLSIEEADRKTLCAYFEKILPEGLADTTMKEFAMTICFQKDR